MDEQEKYLIDGQAVVMVKDLGPEGALVRKCYYDEDRDETFCAEDTILVRKVYDAPPEEKYHARIQTLQDQQAREADRLQDLRQQVEAAKQDLKAGEAIIQRAARLKGLEMLRKYIDGEITHYVIFGWQCGIVPFDDQKCDDDHKTLKLLSLFGNSNGDLTWQINRYRDSSGSYNTVIPCCSYEEALAVMQAHLDETIDHRHPDRSLVSLADRYGLRIDDTYRERCRMAAYANCRQRVEKLQADLAEAQQRLAVLGDESDG